MNKYDVAKEFQNGVSAALNRVGTDWEKQTTHFMAGYHFAVKNMKEIQFNGMNEYLVSQGLEPMGIIKLC